ncbi:acylphosphatase [Alkalibacter rhizosphaerae]|uniref:acylphosphatase n=1 Tax=Alkalibacter rhizosphaerae TaxID=2815577 RepID=A0A975AGJ5_9FIRM|nr:acylphosphatase [Alkalibacter rhizosphaerae]QSX07447.1 acylphosphatase [Alkalibacter rhizosphaerae]
MRVNLLIEGRVQGVGFRWFARELALELGLTGNVRNNADSTVEINAQGDQVPIERFIYYLYEGPNRFARVDHVRVREIEEVEAEKDFEVVLL